MTAAPKRHLFRFSLRTLFAVMTGAGCVAEPPAEPPKLVSARILRLVDFEFKDGNLEYGDPKWEEIRVTDRQTLAKLESFFPNYRQRPTNNVAAGWETGYEIDFNFSRGDSAHVTVSHDLNGADLWTMGMGDFETKGDFKAFVKKLSPITH